MPQFKKKIKTPKIPPIYTIIPDEPVQVFPTILPDGVP